MIQAAHKIVLSQGYSIGLKWHSARSRPSMAKSILAVHDTMTFEHRGQAFRDRFPIMRLAIVFILVLVLLGGLFHHHESQSDSAACSYCHAGVQTPVIDLAGALAVPFLANVGSVIPTRPSCLPRVVQFSTLVPRAPPVTTHPVVFWEGCDGLV